MGRRHARLAAIKALLHHVDVGGMPADTGDGSEEFTDSRVYSRRMVARRRRGSLGAWHSPTLLVRDDFSSNHHPALFLFEHDLFRKPVPTFGIMLCWSVSKVRIIWASFRPRPAVANRWRMCLLQRDVGRADHAGPLFRIAPDKLSEIGGRTRERLAAKVGKPRLHPGIGEGRIDLLVEPVDDLD